MPIHGNLGGFIKPGFNPLGPQTEYLYEMYAWGYNGDGQLGLGDTTNRSSPVQVGALDSWEQAASGENHTLVTKIDGTLWAWGDNFRGQLGQGDTTDRNSPVQVGALTTWLQVAGGYSFSLATTTDGKLYAWGYNGLGNLGLGDTTNRSSPVQVGSLTTWGTLPKMSTTKSSIVLKL